MMHLSTELKPFESLPGVVVAIVQIESSDIPAFLSVFSWVEFYCDELRFCHAYSFISSIQSLNRYPFYFHQKTPIHLER
jgi:hypothetical protein